MNEYPLDPLLPPPLQDWLNVHHEYMAQTNEIRNKIIDDNGKINSDKYDIRICR